MFPKNGFKKSSGNPAPAKTTLLPSYFCMIVLTMYWIPTANYKSISKINDL